MKKSLKGFLAVSICMCMIINGTVYAQDEDTAGQEMAEMNSREKEEAPQTAESTQKTEKADEVGEKIPQADKGTQNQSPALARTGGVEINEANFPDANFRGYVSEQFDTDKDGSLSESEINGVSSIFVDGNNISSLAGIEYFTGLQSLSCVNIQLASLDVSKNTNLLELYCGFNQLSDLDVSKNTNLQIIECQMNQLTELDVSKNIHLEHLNCSSSKQNSQLTNLNISENAALQMLDCSYNQLDNLDSSNNTALQELRCANNQLANLDVSKNIKLQKLDCQFNQLSNLDVSKNINLQSLLCNNNQLTSLELGENINLKIINCMLNQLTSVDVSKNTALQELRCANNQLVNLDVSKNIKLQTIWCQSNRLTGMDVSKNIALQSLYFHNNQLTSLDVSKNIALKNLGCDNNRLSNLDVSENTELQELWCEQNKLANLDVRNCIKLNTLWVRPLEKENVLYTQEPAEFIYGTCVAPEIIGKCELDIKADTTGITPGTIYKTYNIDPENEAVKIIVEQKDASKKDKEYLANLVRQSGDRILKLYEVVMNLYVDDTYKGLITDNFGNLTLSFYAGTEYAGQRAIVYQLHGEEVIPHRDNTINREGMVTITVPKLSAFAIALQDAEATNAKSAATNNTVGHSAQTGDSANIIFWFLLAAFAMPVLAVSAIKRRKR